VTVIDVEVFELGLNTPRFFVPVPVVPSQSWYWVTLLAAFHEKVADDPDKMPPGVGLLISPMVEVPASK
jgi:hypothetical protein